MTTAAYFNEQGILLKRQGRLDEARQSYERALQLEPNYAEARYNLGVLWRDLGRTNLAIDQLRATLQLRQDVPVVHLELANLLASCDEFDQAIEHYEQAIALDWHSAAALYNLVNVFIQQRRWTDAEAWFRQIVERMERCLQFGQSLQSEQRFAEAVEVYTRLLDGRREYAAALTTLANANKEHGRLSEARACYERALNADSTCDEALANLGNLLLECGQPEKALTYYTAAAKQQTGNAQAFVRLGNAQHRMERITEAIQAYEHALGMDHECADAWISLGHLRRELGDFDQARATYHALATTSRRPLDRLRELACCPHVFSSGEQLSQYRAELEQLASEMRGADLDIDFRRLAMVAPECPYNLQFLDGNLRAIKEAFAAIYSKYFEQYDERRATRITCHAKPRIGFVVTHRHESAFLKLIAGVVERLSQESFDVVILCSTFGAAKIQAGLHRDNAQIIRFAERFDHVVATIRSANCDLLYYWEIGNDPTNYFLPFLRLAPVQVTSWGIQVTSGIPNIDAYLSSDLIEVSEAQQHYSETLVLAKTLLTFQSPIAHTSASDLRDALGQTRLYGCLQNLGKFHPDFDRVLDEILQRDPQGRLLVAEDRYGHAANVLRLRWQKYLPQLLDRVVFLPMLDQKKYLSVLNQCHVLLDPLHFGGVTTTYDAIALGKPVVTLPTEYHRGRYTAGCLRKLGVTDTIARDVSDYVDLAVALASDTDRRADLTNRMFEARHRVFEDYEAVREHERIFQELLAKVR